MPVALCPLFVVSSGMTDRRQHWDEAYTGKAEEELSWYQASSRTSLALIENTGHGAGAPVIDVGGGASRLVDGLLDRGYTHLTVLDLVQSGLTQARQRLGRRASKVEWVVADITTWKSSKPFDVWHDRAVFHFLTDKADRTAYRAALERALSPGGQAIIGTFAPDGPDRCRGLPVMRYDGDRLARELGPAFHRIETVLEAHATPGGNIQHFQFSRFDRVA